MTRATFRPRRPARLAPCLALALLVTVAACGKKGPPLAPLIRLPAAPDAVVLQRRGDLVAFQFRVPAANSDGSAPADLARVEVYGYTGVPRDDAAILRDGTLVASIPVRRPPAPEEGGPAGEFEGERPPGSMTTGFGQGETVTVAEPIGAEQRQVVVPSRRDDRRPLVADQGFSPSRGGPVEIAAPLRAPFADAGDSRLYAAVGVSRKGRNGRLTAPARASLLPAPSPPLSPSVAYDAASITLTWKTPPDMQRPTLPPPSDPALLEAKPLGMPSLSGGFNVYRAPQGAVAPEAAGEEAVRAAPLPAPLNTSPLPEPRFEEPTPSPPEGERCYVVTTVTRDGEALIESAPSEAACVTMADVFPPAPPKGLAAVGSTGGVSLIWEASSEPDLAGYLVLRSEAGGAFTPLTEAPIAETTLRDERVTPGIVYGYVVIAVDKAGNRSEPSNRAEESAR